MVIHWLPYEIGARKGCNTFIEVLIIHSQILRSLLDAMSNTLQECTQSMIISVLKIPVSVQLFKKKIKSRNAEEKIFLCKTIVN